MSNADIGGIMADVAGPRMALFRPLLKRLRRRAPPAAPAPASIEREAMRNIQLLHVIARANNRLLVRGEEGGEPWARLMSDTYDHVCRECQARRSGAGAPDAYFEALAQDPDVRTVCDERLRLREAVVDYRRRIEELAARDPGHDALEREIRNALVIPDCTPAELHAALNGAMAMARQLAL
jgi:hypothetical protein